MNYALIECITFHRKIQKGEYKGDNTYKNNLIGIYKSYEEAEFILSKAKKHLVAKDAVKSIEYDIVKTDKQVTTSKVGNYINRNKQEVSNG